MTQIVEATPIPGDMKLERYAPEPSNTLGEAVRGILRGASSVLGGGAGTGIGDANPWDLINQQIEIQREMMMVTLWSNVKKSEHETEMAPVRNIRVG